MKDTGKNHEGKFFVKFGFLAILQDKAKFKSCFIAITVYVSVLQPFILWQTSAVAKLPGHIDKTASIYERLICGKRNMTLI